MEETSLQACRLDFNMKTLLRFYCSHILLLLVLVSYQHHLTAQNTNNIEAVKRLQRSIFIFNFAQQVAGWPELEESEVFQIGVLGPDRTIIDLNALAKKRHIQGKPVNIKHFNLIKDIVNVQLLYVNNRYNYDIDYILSKITSKHILLVTEDYNYHSSMINIVNVGNSFAYEINEQLIKNEGFIIAPSLSKYAVTTSEKWKELYQNAEQALSSAKLQQEQLLKNKDDKIISQEEIIKQQEMAIDTTSREVSIRDEWIELLNAENTLQKKKYEEMLELEKELEQNIQRQIFFIKNQDAKIIESNKEIKRQKAYLKNQEKEITRKELILQSKNDKIDLHRRINFLFVVLTVILLITGIIVYRSYLTKKRLSLLLEEKNASIEKQSKLLGIQNTELENFNYMATHDLKAPISNIEGYYSFLKEDLAGINNQEVTDSMHWIGISIKQAQKTISDLTFVTQMKNLTEQPVHIELSEITKGILDGFKKDIETNQVSIYQEFDNYPKVYFGKIGLKSILQNLISNAIKYRSERRKLEIKMTSNVEEEYSVISIKDNGIGIDLEKQGTHLFGLFKRIETNTEGSGIGLYLIKKIIENADGKIKVESQPDIGSVFKVYLKRSDD